MAVFGKQIKRWCVLVFFMSRGLKWEWVLDVLNLEPCVIKDCRNISDTTDGPVCFKLIDTDNYSFNMSLFYGNLC